MPIVRRSAGAVHHHPLSTRVLGLKKIQARYPPDVGTGICGAEIISQLHQGLCTKVNVTSS